MTALGDDLRKHVDHQMVHKLIHRVEPLLTGWTPWDHDTFAALSSRWRLINEMIECVSAHLGF